MVYLETSFSRSGSRFSGSSTEYSNCKMRLASYNTVYLEMDVECWMKIPRP
jgi:hypothetical protein